MIEIPHTWRSELEQRIREQIASEVRGDVSAIYEFTLPSIRAKRIKERTDEPELTLSQTRRFVSFVHEAEVESIDIEKFCSAIERHGGCPGAVVITRVRYNQRSDVTILRCIWVYAEGTWYTTALGKIYWGTDAEGEQRRDRPEKGAGGAEAGM